MCEDVLSSKKLLQENFETRSGSTGSPLKRERKCMQKWKPDFSQGKSAVLTLLFYRSFVKGGFALHHVEKKQILTSVLFMQQDYHSLAYSTNIKAKWEEGVLDYWTESFCTDPLPGMKLPPSKKVRKTSLTQIKNWQRYAPISIKISSYGRDAQTVCPVTFSSIYWYGCHAFISLLRSFYHACTSHTNTPKVSTPFILRFNKPGVSCFKVVLGW